MGADDFWTPNDPGSDQHGVAKSEWLSCLDALTDFNPKEWAKKGYTVG